MQANDSFKLLTAKNGQANISSAHSKQAMSVQSRNFPCPKTHFHTHLAMTHKSRTTLTSQQILYIASTLNIYDLK